MILANYKTEILHDHGYILELLLSDVNTAGTYNFLLEGWLTGTNVPDLDVIASQGL